MHVGRTHTGLTLYCIWRRPLLRKVMITVRAFWQPTPKVTSISSEMSYNTLPIIIRTILKWHGNFHKQSIVTHLKDPDCCHGDLTPLTAVTKLNNVQTIYRCHVMTKTPSSKVDSKWIPHFSCFYNESNNKNYVAFPKADSLLQYKVLIQSYSHTRWSWWTVVFNKHNNIFYITYNMISMEVHDVHLYSELYRGDGYKQSLSDSAQPIQISVITAIFSEMQMQNFDCFVRVFSVTIVNIVFVNNIAAKNQ